MFEVYHFSEIEILAFLLVLARISAFFVIWPVLSMANVPAYVKILLSLVVSLVLFPIIGWKTLDGDIIQQQFIFLIVREVFIGILLGYLARLFFFAIDVCGHLASDAMGLTSAQVLNPVAENRTSVLEQFYLVLVTMFYLMINGHHYFVAALVKSFELVPLSNTGLALSALGHSGEFVQSIMLIGLKLAAPIVVSLFVMNIAIGIIGRAVPQMNVLITSLSVNILVGLVVMIISLPLLLEGLPSFLNVTIERMFQVLKSL